MEAYLSRLAPMTSSCQYDAASLREDQDVVSSLTRNRTRQQTVVIRVGRVIRPGNAYVMSHEEIR